MEERKQDNYRLAAESLLVLAGFILVLVALATIGRWLKKKCQKAKRLKESIEKERHEKDKELVELKAHSAELKVRLKALEEGAGENEE